MSMNYVLGFHKPDAYPIAIGKTPVLAPHLSEKMTTTIFNSQIQIASDKFK